MIVTQTTAIDNVLGLFGNIRFMRLQVKLISTTTELVGSVVFYINTAIVRRTVVSTHPESIHIQFSQFGKSVSIGIIRITVAICLIKGNTVTIILGYQRDISPHVLFPRLTVHVRHHTGYLKRVADRIFCDNINRSSHSIGTKQSRPATTHDFYPLDHIYRNLFQSIHPGKGTDNRTAIYQYLRIRSLQTINTHLRKATVLTVVFHAKPGLKVQRLCKISRIYRLKKFGAHHIDHYGSLTTVHFVTIGRYNNFISHKTFLFHLKMENGRKILADCHTLLLGLIPHRLHLQSIFTRGKMTKFKLPLIIRHRPVFIGDTSSVITDNAYRSIRDILFGSFHNNVAGNHIAFLNRIDGISNRAQA